MDFENIKPTYHQTIVSMHPGKIHVCIDLDILFAALQTIEAVKIELLLVAKYSFFHIDGFLRDLYALQLKTIFTTASSYINSTCSFDVLDVRQIC